MLRSQLSKRKRWRRSESTRLQSTISESVRCCHVLHNFSSSMWPPSRTTLTALSLLVSFLFAKVSKFLNCRERLESGVSQKRLHERRLPATRNPHQVLRHSPRLAHWNFPVVPVRAIVLQNQTADVVNLTARNSVSYFSRSSVSWRRNGATKRTTSPSSSLASYSTNLLLSIFSLSPSYIICSTLFKKLTFLGIIRILWVRSLSTWLVV